MPNLTSESWEALSAEVVAAVATVPKDATDATVGATEALGDLGREDASFGFLLINA